MLPRSRRFLLLLFAAAGLAFFIYKSRNSVSIEGFHWAMLARSLRDVRLGLLALGVVAIYGCFALRALRWMQFSRVLGATHFWNVYSATLMGFTCTFLLGRPGEPIRPMLIATKDSIPVSRMFGVYVLERVFDMAAAAVLACAGLLLFKSGELMAEGSARAMAIARSAGALLLVLLLVAVAFLCFFRYRGGAWLAGTLQRETWRTGWRKKVVALLEGFGEGLQGIRTWGDLGALLGYTAAHWLLVVLVYWWVAYAFGGRLAQIGFPGATLALAFTLVGSAAQLPGAGGGAQAATFFVYWQIFGVQRETALVAAVVMWLVTFVSCSLVGVPLLLREGWSVGELRQMARREEAAGPATLLSGGEGENLQRRSR